MSTFDPSIISYSARSEPLETSKLTIDTTTGFFLLVSRLTNDLPLYITICRVVFG